MSNTVITNFTDISGPSTKTDNSVVVIVNKDGSLSVDQEQLGTLMGNDGLQSTGISVVRVGHEGKPDDATDTESDEDNVPHVTLSVDSYYNEPNSIIKYDSGAEMLQSLRIETRENSLLGFQNDHCYTPINASQISDNLSKYDESVIEITHAPPPKPIPSSKKITVLEEKILPKGRKIIANTTKSVTLKGNLLPASSKHELKSDSDSQGKSDTNDSVSDSSYSAESAADRDSDVDYKESRDRSGPLKKSKTKPKILKTQSKQSKTEPKLTPRQKSNRIVLKREIKEKNQSKTNLMKETTQQSTKESILKGTLVSMSSDTPTVTPKQSLKTFQQSTKESILKGTLVSMSSDTPTVTPKQSLKTFRKEKKTAAHSSALLSDMSTLFSTPDVIRRVSTDNKTLTKVEQTVKSDDTNVGSIAEGTVDKHKNVPTKTYSNKQAKIPDQKVSKAFEPIPQLDDASLAQILQNTPPTNPLKGNTSVSNANVINSPGLAGPLSPTLDLLGGLQPEEEGLTEDLLMHVAQLVESSENLQEVIDKQLTKVETAPKAAVQQSVQAQASINTYPPSAVKSNMNTQPQKAPMQIIRRDGRIITLPPIEAPATRSSKKKTQTESGANESVDYGSPAVHSIQTTPEPQAKPVAKQYSNKKVVTKKQEIIVPVHPPLQQQPLEPPQQPEMKEIVVAESQESWNSEDDPFRLWCICRQPHNNRFMICCDGCEDWFHGKCVNITKAMGQQMEEQGIEWRCPNCIMKAKPGIKLAKGKKIPKMTSLTQEKSPEGQQQQPSLIITPKSTIPMKTNCIVCKKPARASSIYCSNSCIVKHAQDSLGSPGSAPKTSSDPGKSAEKTVETRFIVYEPNTGKLLAGPNAPTGANLKVWLQQHPTFEVVRSETHTVKPKILLKKPQPPGHKVQTILNFERLPKKPPQQTLKPAQMESKEIKLIPAKEMKQPPTPVRTPVTTKTTVSPKTPVTPKTPIMFRQPSAQKLQYQDTPRPTTSSAKTTSEQKKPVRTSSRTMSEKGSPAARRKDSNDGKNVKKPETGEEIRENVRKALQEHLTIRMNETKGTKFTEDEIKRFAYDTESELQEVFKDVGIKYKAKYRSLMFNIKDRKNQSLWQKICDKTITPKQLVRLSPEELASQELAQWRDQEAKHQLELIKKSELDLLAASKTYVLKTHKGEEVMEAKTTTTELDPNVAVEDLVSALNDDSATTEQADDSLLDKSSSSKFDYSKKKKSNSPDKKQEDKKSRESKRDHESRKSRRSEVVAKVERSSRRHEKKSSRDRSESRDRHTRSRRRSRSKDKSKRHSKSHSKSLSRSSSKGRDRSHSRSRSRRRSKSRDESKRKRSHSKYRSSTEEKSKHHRSKSQEASTSKANELPDSDAVERPKSALLKDQSFSHPEYDPHEPMITSALSDEDLRKSRENVYEATELGPYDDLAYDPEKFTIDTSVLSPPPNIGKFSEGESDQEPSSTVDSAALTVWNGCINMVDVARFYVAAHQVSGGATDLEEDLTAELDIVGRINPVTVWDYISKMKKSGNKDIVVLRLQAANDEEMMQYIALYSYLNTRNRLGVVKVTNPLSVKDFYVVPLSANSSPPSVLLPFEGPGLGDIKTHLLLAVLICHRRKRPPIHIAKEMATTRSRKRSYTPPMVNPAASPKRTRRGALPVSSYTSPALSTSVKDKIAASLAMAAETEAYSPGSISNRSGSGEEEEPPTLALPPAAADSLRATDTLRTKMAELNRQIEEQKLQIRRMVQPPTPPAAQPDQEEAYSPSRPMTPPESSVVHTPALANINLPSNLQEILATIKQRSET